MPPRLPNIRVRCHDMSPLKLAAAVLALAALLFFLPPVGVPLLIFTLVYAVALPLKDHLQAAFTRKRHNRLRMMEAELEAAYRARAAGAVNLADFLGRCDYRRKMLVKMTAALLDGCGGGADLQRRYTEAAGKSLRESRELYQKVLEGCVTGNRLELAAEGKTPRQLQREAEDLQRRYSARASEYRREHDLREYSQVAAEYRKVREI